jgi:hypothetical protein
MSVLIYPYEREKQIVAMGSFKVFQTQHQFVKDNEAYLKTLFSRRLLNTLLDGDIYIFDQVEKRNKDIVLFHHRGEYIGHLYYYVENSNTLQIQGIRASIEQLINKKKGIIFFPDLSKFMIQTVIKIASIKKLNKVVIIEPMLHMRILLQSMGFKPECDYRIDIEDACGYNYYLDFETEIDFEAEIEFLYSDPF